MLETAAESGVKLRGQTKTHKTVEGGVLQTGGTRRGIVTSTLVEVSPSSAPAPHPAQCFQCEMYAEAGFDDILYGFPFIPAHFERIYRLSQVRGRRRGRRSQSSGDWSCPAETD